MRRPRRLDSHPLTPLERGAPLTFWHEGSPVSAYGQESVAAALYAAGRVTLSRSMRYHRARGLFCGTGTCTHCFQRIDGVPNVRSCTTSCTPTTWAEGQNALPNVEFDALAGADLAFPRYLDAHSAFIRPTFLKPLYTRLIRFMAGYGRVPKTPVEQRFGFERDEPDVLVVGGGPAGLAAAEEAAIDGAMRVTLVETEERLGGRLRELPTPFHAVDDAQAPKAEGKAYARDADERLRRAGVRVRTGARVFGVYGPVWAASSETALVQVRPQRVVVATGSLDAYDAFPGSDRSGVLMATAALRLVNRHGILPLEPVVIYGATRPGLMLARDLAACGAKVAGVYDPRPPPAVPTPLAEDVRRLGIDVKFDQRALFVAGRKRPAGVVFRGPRGRVRVACGALVLSTGRLALGELFQQAGARLVRDTVHGSWVPVLDERQQTTVPGVFAAGSCAGARDEWESVLTGRRAGRAAAASLQKQLPLRVEVAR